MTGAISSARCLSEEAERIVFADGEASDLVAAADGVEDGLFRVEGEEAGLLEFDGDGWLCERAFFRIEIR